MGNSNIKKRLNRYSSKFLYEWVGSLGIDELLSGKPVILYLLNSNSNTADKLFNGGESVFRNVYNVSISMNLRNQFTSEEDMLKYINDTTLITLPELYHQSNVPTEEDRIRLIYSDIEAWKLYPHQVMREDIQAYSYGGYYNKSVALIKDKSKSYLDAISDAVKKDTKNISTSSNNKRGLVSNSKLTNAFNTIIEWYQADENKAYRWIRDDVFKGNERLATEVVESVREFLINVVNKEAEAIENGSEE